VQIRKLGLAPARRRRLLRGVVAGLADGRFLNRMVAAAQHPVDRGANVEAADAA
jgi:hypothetical protein